MNDKQSADRRAEQKEENKIRELIVAAESAHDALYEHGAFSDDEFELGVCEKLENAIRAVKGKYM